jgi:mutator protein MutT
MNQKKHEEADDFLNLGIIINSKKEVLMIRRAKPEKGEGGSVLKWAFPGGKQRLSESREEGVAREVLAETGYEVESLQQLDLQLHPQIMVTIVYHLCSLKSPEPIANPCEEHEVAEIRWVPVQEVKKIITTSLNSKVDQYFDFLIGKRKFSE